jgi:Metal binding domain of Ada
MALVVTSAAWDTSQPARHPTAPALLGSPGNSCEDLRHSSGITTSLTPRGRNEGAWAGGTRGSTRNPAGNYADLQATLTRQLSLLSRGSGGSIPFKARIPSRRGMASGVKSPVPLLSPTRVETSRASVANGSVVGNRRTRIYHRPDCPDYGVIAPQNRVPFGSAAVAESAGYRLARNCP